jgi:hypothetical protein
MFAPPLIRWSAVAALAVLGPALSSVPAVMADEVEILTRGPVHEAFAGTISFNAVPTVVVSRECPAPINELPPELRPLGTNVTWIPGYWAWDDDRNNFLWLSGIWRDIPVGRQWIPGYWSACDSGNRWTAGYWADAKVAEVEYLPEPPQSIEAGPVGVAPSADYVWIPGIWVWRHGHYVWRPGFWAGVQAGWTWIPDHYVWSPGGCVFVNGYWDYELVRRGTVFAPVCFNAPVFTRTAYVYSPSVVIGLDACQDRLFVRPNYCHYYFGDYYAATYDRMGFFPCYAFHEHHGYDPIFVHERWVHRGERDWDRHVVEDFRLLRDHHELRPPRTWVAQQSLLAHGGAARGHLVVASSLRQFAESHHSNMHFVPVSKAEVHQLAHVSVKMQEARHEREVHEVQSIRHAAEVHPGHSRPLNEHTERNNPHDRSHMVTEDRSHSVTTTRLARSPIVSNPSNLNHAHLPPKAHVAPEPDLRIQAKPGQVHTPTPAPKRSTSHPETHPASWQHHPAEGGR